MPGNLGSSEMKETFYANVVVTPLSIVYGNVPLGVIFHLYKTDFDISENWQNWQICPI